MAEVFVEIRSAGVLLWLKKGEKKLAYAVANALNGTAKSIQQAQRERLARGFMLRKRDFMLRQVAVIRGEGGGSGFASVGAGRYAVRLQVGQKARLLLSEYESGGPRRAFKGKRVAIPVLGGARPTHAQSVPESLWVQRLALRRARRGSKSRGGKLPLQGLLGTYLVPGIGIFQRQDGQTRGRMLYVFKESVRLSPILRWVETCRRVASVEFGPRLQSAVRESFRHAMGG